MNFRKMFQKPHIIEIKKVVDDRGQVNFFELGKEIDFEIKRVYYLSNVAPEQQRGKHAHKKLRQLMIAVNGVVEIEIDDGKGNKNNFVLDSIDKALYLPVGYWRVLKFSSPEALCFVFASEKYEEDDYIKDYQEFVEYKKNL